MCEPTTITLAISLASAAIGAVGARQQAKAQQDALVKQRKQQAKEIEAKASLELGFSFEFYGILYSDFRISSNGFITLGPNLESQGCCTGQPIPQTSSPNNFIAGFWEDLNVPQGNIRFQTLGSPGSRQLVVGFYGAKPS